MNIATESKVAPKKDADTETILEEVLSNKQRIVSHIGSGQYNVSSGTNKFSTSTSISACGLAAMNCARLLFQQAEEMKEHCTWCGKRDGEHREDGGRCLVDAMLAPQTSAEIVSICSSWTNNSHLEVDELLQLPIFKKSFLIVNTKYGKTTPSDFRTLLMDMTEVKENPNQVVACIITRPPEILLCMKIPVSGQDIFVIFDSHPRPTHPEGSGFILNASLVGTAEYLEQLLSIDSSILADPSLRWQAELLGHFSGHIVVSKPNDASNFEIDEMLMDATLQMLLLKAEVVELQLRESSLASENGHLHDRVMELETEKENLEKTVTMVDRKGKRRAVDRHSTSRKGSMVKSRPPERTEPSGSSSRLENEQLNMVEHLQARFDEEDRQLALERGRLLQQNQTFDCRICLETLPEDHIAKVEGCNHAFCRECLRAHVSSTVKSRRYPIPCPVCVADNKQKPSYVDDTTAMTLGISEATFEILQELQLAKHSTILHCRKCKETMFVDKDEYRDIKLVVCPLRGCNNVWCKSCEQTINVGGPQHSCDGTSEFQHLMKTSGWKACPGCSTPIQKESGCNHMTCGAPGCNTHFCYVCGELITSSLSRGEIKSAISRHYSRCALFQDVAGA
ncbi:hypothetical protein CPB83DRAFT_859743 [Crepidotus variabilis]|uniref:RING-type domain-containing protein n=1 Tax=Crepidotus variabilis TaxID=179855 RepID=A0A9P6EAA2_9AGAR|nr:hypothetical protein CPB83DRAFT_859743 [Crepidotus variabilis]